MAQKFCAHEGCYLVAARKPRSGDYCGEHYLTDVLAGVELVRAEVVGGTGRRGEECRVTDARTGQSRGAGQIVELDPVGTSIAAVVAAGAVRILPSPAAEALKTASAKKG